MIVIIESSPDSADVEPVRYPIFITPDRAQTDEAVQALDSNPYA